jgi:hypothetical protein
LAEGEKWTENDFNKMKIEFLLLYDAKNEELDHEWRYEMTKYA